MILILWYLVPTLVGYIASNTVMSRYKARTMGEAFTVSFLVSFASATFTRMLLLSIIRKRVK
jgi:hypothetical protein